MSPAFDLQGHRGARGQRPENTLPSFEAAFDAAVTSVETDLLLTRDDQLVLCHDPLLGGRLFLPADADTPPAEGRAVRALTLAELRRYRVAGNPDPGRFREQIAGPTPLARRFAADAGFDPLAVPTLADLFAFAARYAGEEGRRAGKSAAQREAAARVRFDLELKREPFHPEYVGDDYDGTAPAALERATLDAVRAAGVLDRVSVRSFDNRCVRLFKDLESRVGAAVLVGEGTPAAPEELARAAGADTYCPDYLFLDADLVRRLRRAGVRVVPYTVNDPEHARRLLAWGVNGVTTDFPALLAERLRDAPPAADPAGKSPRPQGRGSRAKPRQRGSRGR
jgi:glycerophosphoryl diester phosphodiesterase